MPFFSFTVRVSCYLLTSGYFWDLGILLHDLHNTFSNLIESSLHYVIKK